MPKTETASPHENNPFLSDHSGWGWLRLGCLVVLPLIVLLTAVIVSAAFGYSSLPGRLLLVFFLAFISAFAAVVYYIQDIYAEETDQVPFRYFIACFFGILPPKVVIERGEKKSDWLDVVEKLGGPAQLDIRPGYAVLTESLTAPVNVFKQGKERFMTRMERIYEVIDLHEQQGEAKDITINTRDGLPIVVKNIKFNYRLWDSRWETLYKDSMTLRNPFPCSRQAVFNFVYNRSVQIGSDKEREARLTPWLEAVKGPVTGIIKDYIGERVLDDVIAPREHRVDEITKQPIYPRDEIRKHAYNPEFQKKLQEIGTILRWWDPGEYYGPTEIEAQVFRNWSVDLMRGAQLNKAYGEAQKTAYEELGRAEAEAELLMSIIHALDEVDFRNDRGRSLQNVILMRTAQLINAINTSDGVSEK